MLKAVILAAGKSTRTWPLTENKPKPLLKILNKTILENTLNQLQGIVKEAVIIIGFKGEQIKEKFGNNYKGIKLTYIAQNEPLGSGHALLQAKNSLENQFIVLNGDDFYSKKDIKKCLKHDYCILLQKVENPSEYGEVCIKGKKVTDITEKPAEPKSHLVNTGVYVLKKDLFSIELKKSPRGEYEILDYLRPLIKEGKLEYETADEWQPLTYPWSLLSINEKAILKAKKKIEGTVEKNATIKGEVVVGKGTIVKSGAYIEGPAIIGKNCSIGPNCYLRSGTTIGDNSKVGNAVEIKNSIIGDNTHVSHLSYIGDSILGDNVNIGAGTITANLKHDNQNVKSEVKGELKDTGRRKLGVIMGDSSKTGINTSFYPGRKMGYKTFTMPNEVVKQDVRDNRL